MMVRLAFSVSVFVKPEILVVDEALAVGDAVFQFKCLERLKQLTKSGATLLFVSHDIQMVKSFCDRAVYLHKGEMKAEGGSDEVAEYYIMDVHDEQQSQRSGSVAGVSMKPFVGSGDGIAFGTSQGRIAAAFFNMEQGALATYQGGDVASFAVEVEYKNDLKCPYITAYIQNSKLVGIGGKSFPLSFTRGHDGLHRGRVDFEFPISFGAGEYFITLKLESHLSELEFYPVDKQVGVLCFKVLRRKHEFLGSVDVGLSLVGQQQL
jgi:lipopolysaccharide transport system ATP-binding protein